MRIVVVGCGRFGAELAYRLYQRGHQVSVIDQLPLAFSNLPADFQGRLNEGDAINQDVLHRAGIETADGVATTTNSDALNAVISHVAKVKYKIQRVVARNYDPNSRSLYETFGIQMISASSWGAQRMEEMLYYSEIRTVFSVGNGEVEIYEINVPEAWNGKKISDTMSFTGCVTTSITRAGRSLLPDPKYVLNTGDLVYISATYDGIEALRSKLSLHREEE